MPDGKALLQQIRRSPIDLVPGKTVVSVNPGDWTSPFEGKGYEPLGYRDFAMGDNPRRIHLPTSARRGAPTIVERVALRDYKLMVVIDLSPSMSIRQKPSIQLEVAALLLYAAWQAETTFLLATQTGDSVRSYGPGTGSRHFFRLYRVLRALCGGGDARSEKGVRVHLGRCLPPNAMLVYCSDFLDARGRVSDLKKLMSTVYRYDFIPVVIQDDMEYDFPVPASDSLIPFVNPETGLREEMWISARSAGDIRTIHQTRFGDLAAQFGARGIKPIHLASPGVKPIRYAIDAFFRRRKRMRSM